MKDQVPPDAAGRSDAPPPEGPAPSFVQRIGEDDPLRSDVGALLHEHLADMRRTSPPESVHALDPASLAQPGIVFLTARAGDGALLGCGALKALPEGGGEIKSMRTALAARGGGVGSAILAALLDRARAAGFARVSLETGSQPFFDPAVRLYGSHGFAPCGPFGDYTEDPNSRYLTLALGAADSEAREHDRAAPSRNDISRA